MRTNTTQAFDDILRDKNVLVIGAGGSGKSVMIRSIMELFGDETVLVAPTGLAAINVGGQTAHSAFSIPFGIPTQEDIKSTTQGRKLFGVRSPVRRLIIEEVGMITSATLWFIDQTLRTIRKKDKPFGGLQIILVGDFYQVDCIVKQEDKRLYWNTHGFPEAFKYKEWDNLGLNIHVLTEVFRQKDPEFKEVLGRIRSGVQTLNDLAHINTRVAPNNGSTVVCMTNWKADRLNEIEFNKIDSPVVTYKATRTGNFTESPVPEILNLKVGTKVMICANNKDPEYVNGDIGIVKRLNKASVVVETERNGLVTVKPFEYTKTKNVKDHGKIDRQITGRYKAMPMKHAYSINAHKIQGSTMENVHVDFERGTFSNGQAYVALSRVRSLAGLTLERPIRMDDIKVNPRAAEFMKEFDDDD